MLKEYPEMPGRDIRAVENPYEAVFELAGTVGDFSRRTVLWLGVLAFFFLFYIALTIFVVYMNLYVFNASDLRYLGLAMACINIVLGLVSLYWISLSLRSFRLIGRNHGLLLKVDCADPGKNPASPAPPNASRARPQNALNGLIETTISDSRRLLGTFRYVYLFIAVWMVNAVVFFCIQSFRFGPNIMEWAGKLDWIGPGGFGGDAFLFLLVSSVAYLMARRRFDFLVARYQAIEYAMNRPRMRILPGDTAFDRYKAFITAQGDFGPGARVGRPAYFSGTLEAPSGTILVKALERTPDLDCLAEFVRHARAHGTAISHAVLLYPDDADSPLPEAVYEEVVNSPVRTGKELFTVELVMEGNDGFYDFIPVVSP